VASSALLRPGYSLGGFQMLIVVAGDQDGIVRKLCMQGIGLGSGIVHFSHLRLKEALAKIGAGRDSVKQHAP